MKRLLFFALLLLGVISPVAAQETEMAKAIHAANNEVKRLYREGKYAEGLELARQTLERAEKKLVGADYAYTLISMDNLASLYQALGRYGEAEPLLRRALEAFKQIAGPEHPLTLIRLNNLAKLYLAQGRYEEAEPLLKRALETRKRVLGPEHLDTVVSLVNLGSLYDSQGLYGEAESLYKRALETANRVLGPEHPYTLTCMNNLGVLYSRQGRYGEAEPLLKRALETGKRVLGPEHPDTLASMNNLLGLYDSQDRYEEVESLLKRALETLDQAFGPDHPQRLIIANNLAEVYRAHGRYGEAESLLKRTLEAFERVLGPEHPNTLNCVDNLAKLYDSQGRYGEAEPLYQRALEARERVLGPEHPNTLINLANLALLFIATDRRKKAFRTFQALDNRLASWLGAETNSTQGAALRRKILADASFFQNLTYNFILRHPSEANERFAADLTLRWKKRLAQDAAWLANLRQTSKDPRIAETARTVQERKNALANAALDPSISASRKEAMKQSLEAAEAELRRKSAEYRRYTEVKLATAQEVQDVLPAGSALIEYRIFKPANFKERKFGELHLLAVVLRHNTAPALIDLGVVGPAFMAQKYLIDAKARKQENMLLLEVQRNAFDALIAPLSDHLKDVKTLIISPDGPLHAVPFDALLNEDGKALIEGYTVRMVQTGRDLVARNHEITGKGLIAFGGIDFTGRRTWDAAPPEPDPKKLAEADQKQALTRSLTETLEQMERFPSLAHSGDELDAIEKLYVDRRPDEPTPIIYKGAAATEKRLKTLTSSPRVLHLATHGAYLKKGSVIGRPLLQSFVALAGANNGIHGKLDADGENGILHAIEAQSLNLSGTELVVLSACKTGQGVFDYSEGLEGLPRAFHVAGAKNVLVTLWNVGDESTQAFMTTFYDYWTRQTKSDPGAALIETKKFFMSHPRREWRDPQIWAAFVLYEG